MLWIISVGHKNGRDIKTCAIGVYEVPKRHRNPKHIPQNHNHVKQRPLPNVKNPQENTLWTINLSGQNNLWIQRSLQTSVKRRTRRLYHDYVGLCQFCDTFYTTPLPRTSTKWRWRTHNNKAPILESPSPKPCRRRRQTTLRRYSRSLVDVDERRREWDDASFVRRRWRTLTKLTW